jgi:uncharacterized BrkB/YihY/UPF0761 family membrane protein
MRWKVLILTSLVATVAGVGLALVIILLGYNSLDELLTHRWPAMGSIAILFTLTALVGFFVYRHTPRRRKLQTTLAVLLTILLTAAAFALGSVLTPRLHLSRIPAGSGAK